MIILSEAGSLIASRENANLRLLNIFCNILGFSLTPIIPLVLIAIFNVRILQANKLLILPTVINIVAVILSPRFKLVFYIDASNQYQRGSIFIIFVATYVINLILLLIDTVRTVQRRHYPIKTKMISLSVFAGLGTSIQLVMPSVYSSWHCVTLSLILFYLLLSEFDGSLDTLTKLHNRASFEKAAQKLTGKKSFSIIVIDINNFKTSNDTYGHDFGDDVLKTVATILKKSFADHCTCYRVGGDEFTIINSEIDEEKLKQQLKSLINNFAEKRREDNRLPTVAYGYSIFHGDKSMDLQKALKEADTQMYYYKAIQREEVDCQPLSGHKL